MTLGAAIRTWVAETSPGRVGATVAVVVALLAGLVLVSVPRRPDGGRLTSVGPGPPAVPTAGDGATTGGAGVSLDRPATASPDGAPSALPPPAGPPPVAGVPVGGGAPAPTSAGAETAGGDGAPGGPGSNAESEPGPDDQPGADAQPAPPPDLPGEAEEPPDPLTASDVGVGMDEIKVGFLIPDSPALTAAGFVTSSRTDWPEVIAAFVEHANAEGGIHGRRITHVAAVVDPLSASSQRSACVSMTEDQKVFSVFDSASTLGVAQNCYAERQTPFVTTAAQTNSEAFFQQAGGYLAGPGSSGTRVLLNWALLELEAGFIGPGQGKLGILSSECAPDPEMMDREFKPLLADRGVDFLDVRMSCDLGIAQQQAPGAVLQFRQAGVDRVLIAVIFATAQTFLQSAEAQLYRPQYSCSDMWGMCLDVFTGNFPVEQFDGARGWTFTHSGEEPAGLPYNAAVQRCSQILEAAGLMGVEEQMGRDAGAIAYCDTFTLWVTAARATPVNLTRADWVAALPQVGDFSTAYAGRSFFQPGKFTGGDDYAPIEWRRECRCWLQVGDRVLAKT